MTLLLQPSNFNVYLLLIINNLFQESTSEQCLGKTRPVFLWAVSKSANTAGQSTRQIILRFWNEAINHVEHVGLCWANTEARSPKKGNSIDPFNFDKGGENQITSFQTLAFTLKAFSIFMFIGGYMKAFSELTFLVDS